MNDDAEIGTGPEAFGFLYRCNHIVGYTGSDQSAHLVGSLHVAEAKAFCEATNSFLTVWQFCPLCGCRNELYKLPNLKDADQETKDRVAKMDAMLRSRDED